MKTKAVRMYGKNDLRLEEFELPEITDDEILAKVVTDSICMSSYKAAIQGSDHKRVPDDIDENPIIIGHEFCGEVVKVGKNRTEAKPGDKFIVQPAMFYEGSLDSPGYSYPYYGGNATYIVIPFEVFETECFFKYDSDTFYLGSLAEPLSTIVGGYNSFYHTEYGSYEHKMGIVEGGKMAILAGAGPMGLGAIDLALHGPRNPSLLVITDIDEDRLQRAADLYTVEHAKELGIDLHYINTTKNDFDYIMDLSDGEGYNDVFVYAPIASVVEMADDMLATDGCLNFFAGPTDPNFKAKFNFYDVHYSATHICGNTGGNNNDMQEVIEYFEAETIDPSNMITHIGGLDSVAETTLKLPDIPGGKKLIYTHIEMPLTAIDDFEEKGKSDPLFAELAKIVAKSAGLWSPEAEKYLLENGKSI